MDYICQQPISFDRLYKVGETIVFDPAKAETQRLLAKGLIVPVPVDPEPVVAAVVAEVDEDDEPEAEESEDPPVKTRRRTKKGESNS